jgi:hypothetical protein
LSASSFLNGDGVREVAELRARGHRHSSLAIHPYFGKVDPAIALEALNTHSSVGDVILDPFCGSGTVLHDALLAKRQAIGCDSSPLACLIATSKILGISRREERELLDVCAEITVRADLFKDAGAAVATLKVPDMPRVRSIGEWFAPNALAELALIKDGLDRHKSQVTPEVAHLASVAFSRIITAASNQKGESTYSQTRKDDTPGRVLTLFEDSVQHVIRSATAFNAELRANGFSEPAPNRLTATKNGSIVNHGGVSVKIFNMDARTARATGLGRPLANLIVTSPPYLMSWDYGLYHKFRFYWLGFDLDKYEETEIGRHLRRKDDDVERYAADMGQVFSALFDLTVEGASAVFVNAPSVVYGKLVDTNELLANCAKANNWEPVSATHSLGIPGPHHGMYASLPARKTASPGAAGKKEHVLLFRRLARANEVEAAKAPENQRQARTRVARKR